MTFLSLRYDVFEPTLLSLCDVVVTSHIGVTVLSAACHSVVSSTMDKFILFSSQFDAMSQFDATLQLDKMLQLDETL